MNKDRVKKLAEILQAYLAGREIEFYSSILNEWKPAFITDISSLIKNIDNYRIKPEVKYRPFKNLMSRRNAMSYSLWLDKNR